MSAGQSPGKFGQDHFDGNRRPATRGGVGPFQIAHEGNRDQSPQMENGEKDLAAVETDSGSHFVEDEMDIFLVVVAAALDFDFGYSDDVETRPDCLNSSEELPQLKKWRAASFHVLVGPFLLASVFSLKTVFK